MYCSESDVKWAVSHGIQTSTVLSEKVEMLLFGLRITLNASITIAASVYSECVFF